MQETRLLNIHLMPVMSKILLILLFLVLALAIPAFALECPGDSLDNYYDAGQIFAFSYQCDDGMESNIIVAPIETSDLELVKILLGLPQDATQRELLEAITGKGCRYGLPRGMIVCR